MMQISPETQLFIREHSSDDVRVLALQAKKMCIRDSSKRTLACALRMLLSFHCPLKEMSLFLLSGSLLFVDKTVRSYAADLWVEGISTGRINNHRVGELLARLIQMELAPLKRFTTQVYESMYKRSTFHNQMCIRDSSTSEVLPH